MEGDGHKCGHNQDVLHVLLYAVTFIEEENSVWILIQKFSATRNVVYLINTLHFF